MRNAFVNEFETKSALADFVVKSDRLSMGVKCDEFERAFSQKQGAKDAVLFNSGGSANLALLQALKNLGYLKGGDRVGFSAVTWSTNVMPIIQMGLVPVAIDCDTETLNVMSDNLVERILTTDLRALFITNVLGFAGDLESIKQVCQREHIILLEDNCESLGAELPTGKAGNFGVASTFSFFVAHHLSTIEGGMVCTSDLELSEMLRIVRANGWDRNLNAGQQMKWRKRHGISSEFEAKYSFYDLGFNFRPTEVTGFLGLVQLPFLDEWVKIRRENFLRLERLVAENDDLVLLRHDHMKAISPFAFPVVCRSKELKEKYLSRFLGTGIEVRPMVAGNMQRQPFYRKYVRDTFDLPGADFLHDNGFYCGLYPGMIEGELQMISGCLFKY